MEVLTGHSDVYSGAKTLADWGVKEVIITLGSKGSVILHQGVYYSIPAYYPVSVEDATGCGDTYMAGYLYQRTKGAGIQQAGEFAAAMATLKIESSGPFTGTKEDVYALLEDNERMVVNA
jgi:sugar/nucleoside kinase (ribokinase family)